MSSFWTALCRRRQDGKTVDLIKLSAKTGYYIACSSRKEAERVYTEANRLGFKIPFPLTFANLQAKQYLGTGIPGILLDNADLFLQRLYGEILKGISVTTTEK